MNQNKIRQVFKNYIDKFEYINNEDHDEKFKWIVARNIVNFADDEENNKVIDGFRPYLVRKESIERAADSCKKKMEPYWEYIE